MEYNYDSKKIIAVLSSTLEIGVAFNVIGHLATSLGAHNTTDDLMGQAVLENGSGKMHKGIAKYPFIITKLKPAKLKALIHSIKEKHPNLFIADFPDIMLNTSHDKELVKVLQETKEENITYLGMLLYGDSDQINSLTGKFSLWR